MITRPSISPSIFSSTCSIRSRGSSSKAELEEDDRERARFLGGKISLGRKKSRDSNIDDSGNTSDGDKTVGGAIGAYGSGIGEMASEAKRYLDKSSEGLGDVFPGEARE
ncbi:hypothetical protein Tco_0131871, partial [Tanacetum coccineum]